MDIKHEIVCAVKNMAIELGRVPSRDVFCSQEYTRQTVEKHFGTYKLLLMAAGLHEDGKPRLKIDSNTLFYEEVRGIVEQHKPKENKQKKYPKILVIGDSHFPFVDKICLEKIINFAKIHQPDYIVQVGDLLDLYAQSKFPRSQNYYKPEEEELLGKEMAVKMWQDLKNASPNSKCFQLLGNHDVRPIKRVLESAPSLEHVVKTHYKNLMQFEGVTTIDDYRQELVIEDIVFHHGYRTQLGSHRDYTVTNFVCGHSHKGGVVFRKLRNEIIWELNAGFIGDADAKALSYSAQKIHDHTTGFGYIDEYGPRFIPL